MCTRTKLTGLQKYFTPLQSLHLVLPAQTCSH
uniref:Uncharacterized protein n=1 Tax=Anguilla anguilla TaxID=7936 RepID=A0A0E9TEC6_ANGAN